ncbi:hypothetical protein BH18ACT4_BH18ACT4_15760 [soil metagenome]
MTLSRRRFLAVVAAGALGACSGTGDDGDRESATTTATTPPPPAPAVDALPAPAAGLTADPFALGVASGDPAAESVILWTRLVPGAGAAAPPDDDI